MVDLVAGCDDPQLARFAARFLNHYTAHGFQSLTKRDVDLLLFYELELSGIVDRNASNHDVARELRLTPRRVAALRRDAWARWAQQNEINEHLRRTLGALFEIDVIKTLLKENGKRWREDGLVPVLLEHPSDRAEMEQLLKARHSVPQYARNHEVLLVPHTQLLAIAESLTGKVSSEAVRKIQQNFAESTDLKSFLTTDITELSWGKARGALINTLVDVMQKSAADRAAQALVAIFRPLFA